MRYLKNLSLTVLVAVGACHIVEDPRERQHQVCDELAGAPSMVRNPETDACEGAVGQNRNTCPCPNCDLVPSTGLADEGPYGGSTWASCPSDCDDLVEVDCHASDRCRAIYGETTGEFLGCRATDNTGPLQGGDCTAMDFWECSKHIDCEAVYGQQCGDRGCSPGNFLYCRPERMMP